MRKALSVKRFWVIHFCVWTLFLICIYQLVQLTVIRREALLTIAEKQHLLKIDAPPMRGQIVDRQGKELATNLRVPSIYAVPRILGETEKKELVGKLASILDLSPAFVRGRLSRDKAFVWLKRRVSYQASKKIEALKSQGLGMVEEFRRFYPQSDLLSHILGFTNVDNLGLAGIELYMNRELQGRSGKRYTKRDALGREIRAFEMQTIPAVNGHQVTLTIDQHIQYLTERALERAFVRWKAEAGWAVVMDAKTGEVLAMANRPTFDPNSAQKSTAATRRNRVLTDMYEPGSVFKMVALSAVLNEKLAGPDTNFFCENGEYHYARGRTLHDVHGYGDLTLREVIVKSSNIGTVKMAKLLKPTVFQDYIEAFGFGKKSGIDFPGEAPGFTRQPKKWSRTSPYNIPIGHEVMVTALQINTAMAAIANGGQLVQPYLIQKIEDDAGITLQENEPRVKWRVIRPEVAKTVREILTGVVEEGTGKRARIEGIAAGGKTGTAQKVLEDGKGYSHDSFISSFSGFAPAEDPRLVMTVVLDNPKPKYYGGTVAAPVFREVMEPALLSLGYVPKNAKTFNAPESSQGAQENLPTFLPAA